MTTHGWTVPEAVAEFRHTGLPVAERSLRMIVRALPEFRRIGEKPSGEHGGRGEALYDIAEMQQLHRAIAPWLTPQDPSSTI